MLVSARNDTEEVHSGLFRTSISASTLHNGSVKRRTLRLKRIHPFAEATALLNTSRIRKDLQHLFRWLPRKQGFVNTPSDKLTAQNPVLAYCKAEAQALLRDTVLLVALNRRVHHLESVITFRQRGSARINLV